jgi:hypothetical protein
VELFFLVFFPVLNILIFSFLGVVVVGDYVSQEAHRVMMRVEGIMVQVVIVVVVVVANVAMIMVVLIETLILLVMTLVPLVKVVLVVTLVLVFYSSLTLLLKH